MIIYSLEGRRGGGALMTSGSFTMMSANRAGNSEVGDSAHSHLFTIARLSQDDEEELGGGQSTGDTMHDRSELPAPVRHSAHSFNFMTAIAGGRGRTGQWKKSW